MPYMTQWRRLGRPADRVEPPERRSQWFPRPLLPVRPFWIIDRRRREAGRVGVVNGLMRHWPGVRPSYYGDTARGAFRIPNNALAVYEVFAFAPGDSRDYGSPYTTGASLPLSTGALPLPTGGTHEVGLVVRHRNAYGLTDYQAAEHAVYITSAGAAGVKPLQAPRDVWITNDESGNVWLEAYYDIGLDPDVSGREWMGSYVKTTSAGVKTAGSISFPASGSRMVAQAGVVRLYAQVLTGCLDGDTIDISFYVYGGAGIYSSAVMVASVTVDIGVPSLPASLAASHGLEAEVV